MAVRIRLTRVGATKRPAYRVIAIDKRRSRDGRALEVLGYYDPLTEPATVNLETDRIKDWIGKGAQPSDTVTRLMRQAEAASAAPGEPVTPKRASRPSKPKASAKARKGKAEAAEAAPAPTAAEAPEAAAEATAPDVEAGAPEGAPAPEPQVEKPETEKADT